MGLDRDCRDCREVKDIMKILDRHAEEIERHAQSLEQGNLHFVEVGYALKNIEKDLNEIKNAKTFWKEKGYGVFFGIMQAVIIAILLIKFGLK